MDPNRLRKVDRIERPQAQEEFAMSKGEIEQKVTLSRQDAARWLADLAKAIGDGGTVEIALAGPPVTLTLPEEFRCELEIEPYGDEVELEIEFKWSKSRTEQDRPYARAART